MTILETWRKIESPALERTPPDRRQRPPSEGALQAWLGQALKFLAVGVLNTLLDGGLYFVLTRCLGLAALPALAKGISYSAGVFNSFCWNRSWTFCSRASVVRTLLPFVLTNLAALALNAGVMHLGLSTFNLPESVAFVAATGLAFLWNFTVSKFVVFRT